MTGMALKIKCLFSDIRDVRTPVEMRQGIRTFPRVSHTYS